MRPGLWLLLSIVSYCSAVLVGISNCSWTSCRHGCTADVYKCWQVLVNYTLVPLSAPIPPPWGALNSLAMTTTPAQTHPPSRLYPNVRGCGYPPQLQCQGQFVTSIKPQKFISTILCRFLLAIRGGWCQISLLGLAPRSQCCYYKARPEAAEERGDVLLGPPGHLHPLYPLRLL